MEHGDDGDGAGPHDLGFGVARFVLGIGESGNFPASIKTVAEWFPKKERALATGIFNSGANIGAVVAPILVPWLTVRLRLAIGVSGDRIVERAMADSMADHVSAAAAASPRLSKAELNYILSDPPEPVEKIAWSRAAGAPADVGVCDRQIHDGPHLVVHHVLAAEVPKLALRIVAYRTGLAAGDRLQHVDLR